MTLWKRKTPQIPTDLQLLDAIYKHHHSDFLRRKTQGKTQIYVPIKIEEVAETLGVDPQSIFGRLYYHLEHKHGYQKTEGDKIVKVPFFDIDIGGERHCIQFPLMMSILAGLRKEHRESRTAMWISFWAFVTSAASAVAAVIALWRSP
jgi:hypothetical protein